MEPTTTTAESQETPMEYSNYVAYAYFDGQLFMDERYYEQANQTPEESYEMNEYL